MTECRITSLSDRVQDHQFIRQWVGSPVYLRECRINSLSDRVQDHHFISPKPSSSSSSLPCGLLSISSECYQNSEKVCFYPVTPPVLYYQQTLHTHTHTLTHTHTHTRSVPLYIPNLTFPQPIHHTQKHTTLHSIHRHNLPQLHTVPLWHYCILISNADARTHTYRM